MQRAGLGQVFGSLWFWSRKRGAAFVYLYGFSGLLCQGKGGGRWQLVFFFLKRGGAAAKEEKRVWGFLSLGFFCVWLPFSEKLPSCEYFSPLSAYDWMFTYIENLYTCYLRKYCNNYCRNCLL